MNVALSLAGSDPTGGAGVQADLRTFGAFGIHGAAVIASLTIQDTQEIREIIKIPPDLLQKQLTTLLDDVAVEAVKTGILLGGEAMEIVADYLERYKLKRYVLDPIIRSSSSYQILKSEDVESMKKYLLPRSLLITPNLSEAEALTGLSVQSEKAMRKAALEIQAMGPRYVLIKGGHLDGPALDLLVGDDKVRRYQKDRIPDCLPHGAGCVLSAAITAGLASGLEVDVAIQKAKAFVYKAIRAASTIGKGRQVLKWGKTLT